MMNAPLNVLIVEDESLLALGLAQSIQEYGYTVVDYVTNATKAKETLNCNDVSLIIMDINLNDTIDGIDLYKSFDTDIALIYLTAYVDEKTITKAVETHPLGYLTKPHNEGELLALLKLAEIKVNASSKTTQKVKLSTKYSFDMNTNILFTPNGFAKLGGKQAELLKLLIEARGSVVTFATIEDALYKDNPPSESTLRTLIYRLRKHFKDGMIETELNYGIRLV